MKKFENKNFRILLFILIPVIICAGIYFAINGFLNYRKKVQYQNLIKNETDKFNTPNFDDAKYNYIKFSGNSEIEPANFINYEIYYKNTGKQEIQDLNIDILIPENCSLTERNLENLNYSINNNKLIIQIGNLKVADGGKINLTLQANYPSDNGIKIFYPVIKLKYFKENKIINKSCTSNIVIKSEGFLTVRSTPDLTKSYIIIDGSSSDINYKTREEELVYKIRLTNKGNMNAKNIEIKLTDLKNLNLSSNKNNDFNINNISNDTVSAFIPELNVGQQKILYLYASISKETLNNAEIIPKLQISSESFQTIFKTAPKTIVKLYPSFSNSTIKLTDRNGGGAYSGDIIDALITVENNGQSAANNVKINLNLSNLFKLAEGQKNWEIKKLEAGAQATFNCALKIADGITKDSNAYCNLSITSDEGADFTSNNYIIKVTGAKPFTRFVIPIVGFHEVEPYIQNPIELPTGCFDALCATLKNYGYQTITFQDLLDYLDYGKALPEKPVILSSDDGYQDIYTYAFPILKKYGYKMTVFLITNYIGNSEKDRQTNSFDKNRSGVPVRPILIWPEVQEMSKYGCEFLSHTASHLRMGGASADQIINELVVSKNAIESHIRKPCLLFAWPYDNYSDYAATFISKAGYRGGVVYGGGIEDVRSINLRKIKRVTINGYNDPAGYVKLLGLQ